MTLESTIYTLLSQQRLRLESGDGILLLESGDGGLLLNYAPVVDLIDGVYPNRIPQDAARPCVAYQAISTRPIQTHGHGVVMKRKRVQITIVGDTYAESRAVGAAIENVLGSLRSRRGDGLVIASSFLVNEYDSFGDSADIDVFRQDYMILYSEN